MNICPVSAYLDWFNNFLTLPCFARHYGITEKHARDLIKIGREKHEKQNTQNT